MQELVDDYLKDVGKGYEWNGLLATSRYSDITTWLPWVFFGKYAEVDYDKALVTWPTGEKLFFRTFNTPGSYYSIHGWAFQWIGGWCKSEIDEWDKIISRRRPGRNCPFDKTRVIYER